MSRLFSRRQFLKVALPAAGGLAVGAVVVTQLPRATLHRFYRKVDPELSGAAPGTLGTEELDTIMAFAEALLGDLRLAPYADYFQWYAKKLPGHQDLYSSFVTDLDAIAQEKTGHRFQNCSRAQQVTFVRDVRAVETGQWAKIFATAFQRDWLLYNRHIVDPLFRIFVRNDAWYHLGYASPPGTPRGLEHYPSVPQSKA